MVITGTDSESIKGIVNLIFRIRKTNNSIIETCANFLVTEKLIDMDCKLGADLLMDTKKVLSASHKSIV
jgi:hypothetical protein